MYYKKLICLYGFMKGVKDVYNVWDFKMSTQNVHLVIGKGNWLSLQYSGKSYQVEFGEHTL